VPVVAPASDSDSDSGNDADDAAQAELSVLLKTLDRRTRQALEESPQRAVGPTASTATAPSESPRGTVPQRRGRAPRSRSAAPKREAAAREPRWRVL
jgi:hypothetical protein